MQGTLTGSLDNGFFDGSLTASSAGRTSEQRYSGPITTTSAALAPGDCVQGTCAADGLTGAIQTVQTPAPTGPPPPACSYALSPTTASFGGSGGDRQYDGHHRRELRLGGDPDRAVDRDCRRRDRNGRRHHHVRGASEHLPPRGRETQNCRSDVQDHSIIRRVLVHADPTAQSAPAAGGSFSTGRFTTTCSAPGRLRAMCRGSPYLRRLRHSGRNDHLRRRTPTGSARAPGRLR